MAGVLRTRYVLFFLRILSRLPFREFKAVAFYDPSSHAQNAKLRERSSSKKCKVIHKKKEYDDYAGRLDPTALFPFPAKKANHLRAAFSTSE